MKRTARARVLGTGLALALLACAGLATLTGCASVSGGDGAFNAIVKDDTPLSTGPGQDVPDKYLSAGTRVRVVGTAGGGDFLKIQTVSGDVGFVPRAAITDAPD